MRQPVRSDRNGLAPPASERHADHRTAQENDGVPVREKRRPQSAGNGEGQPDGRVAQIAYEQQHGDGLFLRQDRDQRRAAGRLAGVIDRLSGQLLRERTDQPRFCVQVLFSARTWRHAQALCKPRLPKRDHRKLGQEMDLFHLQSEAHGSVFWHPNGFVIYRALEAYMRRRLDAAGYLEVKTPQIMDARQWEQSGHWGKYRANMFVIPDEVPNVDDEGPVISGDADWMALKPMNCPAHVLIFRQGIKSYRDLPLRIYENGCCHRNEPHGALHGLMRVRQFTQDDAHIFCREDQIVEEVQAFCALADRVYKEFGFTYSIKLALRPEQRFGSDADWDKAENELRDAVVRAGLATEEFGWEELPGEGAFYAPKLEWHLTDAIGRTWQVGTIQSDRVLPERLDASYVGEDGARHRPVMLHRAIFGSYERFIGILIEHYAGRFPVWLAPVQAVVATITSEADGYAHDVTAKLKAAGIRVDADTRNEKINYKVREHSVAKVPHLLVVGMREAEEGKVAIRSLGSDGQRIMTLEEAIAMLSHEATPPDIR